MRKTRIIRNDIVRDVGATIAAIVTAAMPMAMMPMKADADDATCSKEDSGAYHLASDCTLHISGGEIHTSDTVSPLTQSDKVKKVVLDDPANTSFYNGDATNAFGWFKNAESITGLDKLDVSHVKYFTSMFYGLKNLKTPVDLSSWDLSNAGGLVYMFASTNLDMFKGYEKFRIGGNNPDFFGMFEGASTSGSIDLSEWKIAAPGISRMENMFAETKAPGGINIKGDIAKKGASNTSQMFVQVDTSSIDGLDELNMSKTTKALAVFYDAKISDPINLSSWDMSSVTDTTNMFNNFNAPNDQDLSSWNMKSVKQTRYMFQNNPDISKFKGIDKWDLSNVNDASYMYDGAKSSKPIRIPTKMTGLNNASHMFANTNIDNFTNLASLNILNVTDASYMFMLASGNYLDMSNMGMYVSEDDGKDLNMQGMLGTPSIKYFNLGDMVVGQIDRNNKVGPSLFEITKDGKTWNAWDDPNLPSYNRPNKRWSRLPYDDFAQHKGKFDGTIESLGSGDDWMESIMWWSPSATGIQADNALKYSSIGTRGIIIFRMVTRPIRFHENITGYKVYDMPDMSQTTWAERTEGDNKLTDCIPNKLPYVGDSSVKFKGWNTKPDGTGTSYKTGQWLGAGTEAMDLYAQWDNVKKVPIRFNDKTGQATGMPENAEKHPGDSYTIPTDTPKRPGYRFKGWATTENGKPAYQPGDTITIGADVDAIDLYPVWEQAGTGVLPSAGLSAKAAPIVATVAVLLLIPMSVFMIRRRRRI